MYSEVLLNLTEVFLTLTEVFPCFFLSCKASARVKLAKTGARPTLFHISCYLCCSFVICTVLLLFVLFVCYLCCSVYCLCVNVYCHRVTTQLQLINISYRHMFSGSLFTDCPVLRLCIIAAVQSVVKQKRHAPRWHRP